MRETSAALVRSRWPCNALCQRSPSSSLVGGPFTLRVHSASRLGLVKHPCLSASGLGGLVCSLLLCHTVVGIVDTLHRQDNQGSACVRCLHYPVSPRRGKRQEVYADIALCSSRRRALSLRHVHGAPPFARTSQGVPGLLRRRRILLPVAWGFPIPPSYKVIVLALCSCYLT